ncbi:MAG: hypothetical protein IJS15_03045 [Victivallales bacterium]|nr:hypothetical protein [Victivallales bacterium]
MLLREITKRSKKILLWILAAATTIALCFVLLGSFVLHRLNESYGQIENDMTIADVKRLLKYSFRESTASFSHVEKDGYPLDDYPFIDEKSIVKQYTYLPWGKLYFYVIYDENGKVQLTVPAFE